MGNQKAPGHSKIMTTNKSLKDRGAVRTPDKKLSPQKPLVKSPAVAEREIAGLRRGQSERDAAPAPGESDARASLL